MSDNSTMNATAIAEAAAAAAEQLTGARYMFAESTLQAMSFGIYVPLALMAIEVLYRRRHQQKLTLYYSCFMLALTITWFCLTTKANEVASVEMPFNAAATSPQCAGYEVTAAALSTLQFVFSDLLLLYRAFVIWDRRPALIAIPALSWLAFVGIGITVNLSCASVAAKINFTPVYLAYFVLSVTTNTLCTILICTRIIMHRREIRGVGIAADVEYSYLTNTMAESGAWYAIAGLVNIAYYVKSSDFAQITETVFGCLAFLTQAHVILRVALGVDYKSVTAVSNSQPHKASTAMAFNNFGRSTNGTGHTGTTAGPDASEVWEMSGSPEKDAERGSIGNRSIPSANRL